MATLLAVSPAAFTITEDDEDTIEMELSAEQMRALSEAAAISMPALVPVRSAGESAPPEVPLVIQSKAVASDPARQALRRARVAVTLCVAGTVLMSGVVAYLSMIRPQPAPAAAAPAPVIPQQTAPEMAPPPSPPAQIAPVRFKNPFDRTEVFEFPPGTSDTDARDAVAAMLLERALERRDAPPGATRVARKAPEDTPATTARLAERN
jgi:hypothetical protein